MEKVGYALYDHEEYEESLIIFQRLLEIAQNIGEGQEIPQFVGLIWQGHTLDLLNRREEAVSCYSSAAAMNLEGGWFHPQFGLNYDFTPYATQRMTTPFTRLENVMKEN